MAKVTKQHTIETTDCGNWDNWEKDYDKGIAKFKELARQNNSGKLVGETIRFQIADGFAVYGILSEKPLHLCHINYGDGYQIPTAHARGLNLTEVRELVRSEHAINKLFS